MIYFILCAILNGLCISLSRVLIGRLSITTGPFWASFVSYIIGFIFVTGVFLIVEKWNFHLTNVPLFAYLGGLFGAIYVVINSYIFTKLGALKTVILIVSGQLISGVIIDHKTGSTSSLIAQLCGVSLILLSIYLSKASNKSTAKAEKVT